MPQVNGSGRLLWRRTSAIGVVAALVWVGNLRPATSEDVVVASAEVVADATNVDPSLDVDGAAESVEARLVPAIYAWDPDVRFIYLRRLSKWM